MSNTKTNTASLQGCQWEVITNAELHYVVSLYVRSTRPIPQRGQDRRPKGAEERIMSLYSVRRLATHIIGADETEEDFSNLDLRCWMKLAMPMPPDI